MRKYKGDKFVNNKNMFVFAVTVHIIEESQYPPVITPLDIEILSYQDDFPGSIVGKVKASDQDPHDVLTYELLPSFSTMNLPPTLHLFEVNICFLILFMSLEPTYLHNHKTLDVHGYIYFKTD